MRLRRFDVRSQKLQPGRALQKKSSFSLDFKLTLTCSLVICQVNASLTEKNSMIK
jgi:hypothetical protein